MKTEDNKKFIRWAVLGAIGGVLMAAGDWLLGLLISARFDSYRRIVGEYCDYFITGDKE